jgi:YHS domain-containing protein
MASGYCGQCRLAATVPGELCAADLTLPALGAFSIMRGFIAVAPEPAVDRLVSSWLYDPRRLPPGSWDAKQMNTLKARLVLLFCICLVVIAAPTFVQTSLSDMNEWCPVTTDEKAETDIWGDFEGRRVYFCCRNCRRDFLRGPRAFIGNLPATEPTTQTICPVSDEEIDKDIFIDHERTRVYLCCRRCRGMFKKDPAKYMAKLAAQPEGGQEDGSRMEGSHMDHGQADHGDAATDATATTEGAVYEVGCGGCIYDKADAQGCEAAVKVDGKSHWIAGVKINAHGLGLCAASAQARMTGELKGDTFVATSFEIVSPDDQDKDAPDAPSGHNHGSHDHFYGYGGSGHDH